MKINGEIFNIYLSDTVDTVRNRLAVSMITLPEYLTFTPKLTMQAEELTVVNEIAPLLGSALTAFPENQINFDVINREDAERLFIATHDLQNTLTDPAQINAYLNYVITGITISSANAIWKERNIIKQKMKTRIDKLRKDVNETTKLFEEFEQIPSIETAEYELATIQFNISFQSDTDSAISLSELFNTITVTKLTPYANMGTFYKTFHDFIPDPNWLKFGTTNAILLKVNGELTDSTDSRVRDKYKKYTDAAFAIIDNRIIATFNMNVGQKYLSLEEYVTRVLKVFPRLDINKIEKISEKSTGGYIIYPNQTMLIPVWAELCMNNPLFNRIVSLNESIRASKIKMNAYVHVLGTNDILSIAMKETEKANMYGMEDEGSNFIKVRVKATNTIDCLKYQKILGRLFTLYNNNKDLILNQYRTYIGDDFLRAEETKLIKRPRKLEKLELRAIAPDIFLPTYSRKCLNRPIIISNEQAEIYKRTKERQLMEFPIFGESIKRYYVCTHKTHPFPGLRENSLENKNTFPYIPCCYTKDQNKLGGRFRHYFAQEKMMEKTSAVQDMFISGKTLPPGLPGVLPPNLKELFRMIEPNPKFQFIRVGSNPGNNSFLECVMLALNINNIKSLQVSDRIPRVKSIRAEIATKINAAAAKQEFYDESIENIHEKLTNSNLNALEFFHVLELVFKCDIFVLSSDEKHPDGTILLPRHAQVFYKLKPSRRTVFIYQRNTGSDEGVAETQCELITRTNTPDTKILANMETSFPYFDDVVTKIWEIFKDLNRSFSHNTILPSIMVPVDLNVKSQIIDIYGKCRIINTLFNGDMISFICDPIPPFNARITTKIYRCEVNIIKDFARDKNITFIKQRLINDHIREVESHFSRGNLNITFLCDDKNRLDSVPIVNESETYEENVSDNMISHFNHNRKIAKIIYQYGLYYLSKFIEINSYTKPLNEQQMNQFINDCIIIKPNHEFKSRNLSSKFSTYSQFVYKNQVVVLSKEMLVRLIYMLRLYSNTHFNELIAYKNKIHINNFYDEISDFDEIPHQFILDSPNAVSELIESYKTNNKVTRSIKLDQLQPYFIYNNVIGDGIYLAQNVLPLLKESVIIKSGLQVSTKLVKFWNKFHYNSYPNIPNEEELDDFDVDVYSYANEEDIINITKYPRIIPGMILGYLVNGTANYTALMPL